MGKSFRHHKREKFTDLRDREARFERSMTVEDEAELNKNVIKFPSRAIEPDRTFCEEHFGPSDLCASWHRFGLQAVK
jgi:hypothetical protein